MKANHRVGYNAIDKFVDDGLQRRRAAKLVDQSRHNSLHAEPKNTAGPPRLIQRATGPQPIPKEC
jgi:hypothetical protein